MELVPGLVAVLRIVPSGDNVALGEMVWRVLSASLTPHGSSVEEMLEESLRVVGEILRGRAHHPLASVGLAEEHWAHEVLLLRRPLA